MWEVWLLRYLLCQVVSDFLHLHWWVQDQGAPHQELKQQRKISRTPTLWDRWTSLVNYRDFLKWPIWAVFPSQIQSVCRKDRRRLYYSQLPSSIWLWISFYTLESFRCSGCHCHCISSCSGSFLEATTQVTLSKLTSRTGPPIWFIRTCADKVRSPGKAEVSAASIVHSASISTWKEQAIS